MPDQPTEQKLDALRESEARTRLCIDIERARVEQHFAYFWKRCHEGRLSAVESQADVLRFAKEAFLVGVSVQAMSDATEPQNYRKKPVVVQAMRWSGCEPDLPAIFEFIGDLTKLPDDGSHVGGPGIGYTPPDGCLYIPTLEGTMTASPGDYIIRGVNGEYYPCKPDIFEATYDRE